MDEDSIALQYIGNYVPNNPDDTLARRGVIKMAKKFIIFHFKQATWKEYKLPGGQFYHQLQWLENQIKILLTTQNQKHRKTLAQELYNKSVEYVKAISTFLSQKLSKAENAAQMQSPDFLYVKIQQLKAGFLDENGVEIKGKFT